MANTTVLRLFMASSTLKSAMATLVVEPTKENHAKAEEAYKKVMSLIEEIREDGGDEGCEDWECWPDYQHVLWYEYTASIVLAALREEVLL